MKHGYWHVPLETKSSYLTTFNTPFGRYRFKRLPFGLHSSAEVLEKRVEQVFGDLDVSIYFDDLIVAGKDQTEHDENLRKLLVRARDANVKFNKDKIQLNRSQVSYLGHIVSSEGLKPDPEKVLAVSNMPEPTNAAGVQRLLGTLNFLRGYIPNMSTLTEPLRTLLSKDTHWSWGPEQKAALCAIKNALTSDPVLKYFDTNKDIELQVDASQSGLGAVLLQDNHPVAYASRSLTPAECNYPQIDKELLAIVFGCERFNHYIYGRPVNVQTDHNPLTSILKKSLHKASPRLQRLMLRLQRYDIAEVRYVPGKHLYLADTLSRAFLHHTDMSSTELEGEKVVMVHSLEVTKEAHTQFTSAYELDSTMTILKQTIQNGWNWSSKKKVPAELQPFWDKKDELYEHVGFVFLGERLIVPHSERKNVLKQLHRGHLGMSKCIDRARRSVYWPGINNDVSQLISGCCVCAKFGNRQQKEPLQPHEEPVLPWNRVAMDILEYNAHSYLVVVDCYSHFPELRLIRNKTAGDVIFALKSIFSVHGVPAAIVADNMPFNSQRMYDFARDWGFDIITSSPHYPKSNGLAERYVQTIKNFLRKCDDTGDDIHASLLAYRETPFTGSLYSPAEMLFNRSLRGNLPCTTRALVPKIVSYDRQLKDRQLAQKQHYDKSAKMLPPLATGDKVFVRTDHDRVWTPATIMSKHQSPRSYLIDNGNNIVRRNRVHLKTDHTSSEDDHASLDSSAADGHIVPPQLTDATSEEASPDSPKKHPPIDGPQRSQRSTRGIMPQRYHDYILK